MVQQEMSPRSIDLARPVLGVVASAHIGAVVFNENYRMLPAVVVAYAAAWWVVRQGGRA